MAAKQLVTDEDGCATGVIAQNAHGDYMQYNASKGVNLFFSPADTAQTILLFIFAVISNDAIPLIVAVLLVYLLQIAGTLGVVTQLLHVMVLVFQVMPSGTEAMQMLRLRWTSRLPMPIRFRARITWTVIVQGSKL